MQFVHITAVSWTISTRQGDYFLRAWVHGDRGKVLINAEYGPMTRKECLDLMETVWASGPMAGDECWLDADGRYFRQLSILED